MTRILIVEDKAELAAIVADYVRAAGYTPTISADGLLALAAIRADMPDLVVLDLMLPGMDGVTLCKAVRGFSAVPIIMVTARVEELDRVLGLESGADDYLCKPFSPRELVARIRAVLRRLEKTAPGSAGEAGAGAGVTATATATVKVTVEVDRAARRIRVGGVPLELTPSEFAILAAMASHPGQVFSRARLLDLAGGDSFDVTDRAVDTHIKNLRRKLACALPDVDAIGSIYGLGYRFEV